MCELSTTSDGQSYTRRKQSREESRVPTILYHGSWAPGESNFPSVSLGWKHRTLPTAADSTAAGERGASAGPLRQHDSCHKVQPRGIRIEHEVEMPLTITHPKRHQVHQLPLSDQMPGARISGHKSILLNMSKGLHSIYTLADAAVWMMLFSRTRRTTLSGFVTCVNIRN